jgi:uncharacterized damage-inducible protein DinB
MSGDDYREMRHLGTPDGVTRPLDRSWPQTLARDELTLLREFLQFLRVTAVNKLSELDTDGGRATPLETSPVMSLMGVVKHLTSVERFWISIVAGGRDIPDPWEAGDADDDFRLTAGDTIEGVVRAYQDEWRRSDEAVGDLEPGDETRKLVGDKRRTVRWVYTHLIQETARHVGHLDVLRELADGRVGE